MSRPVKINLQGVEKRFPASGGKEITALQRLDLEIGAGEFICLVGPSGCGKTTLINLMAGFDRPSSGSITIDGQPVTGPDPDHIMIFQDYGLFPWRTVLGNVLFALQSRGVGKKEAQERATEYLKLVGLSSFLQSFPHQLSGGMKQRVAIARALAVEPSVLFMDEPFAALDAFTRLRLQDEVLRLWEEKRPTVIFVTHDLDEAIYLGGRVILMAPDPGRVSKILPVYLPRPCDRTSEEFATYRRELFEEFHLVHREAAGEAAYSI
ncbi:ABC transporter related protein [Geobacter metallireducens RCH3]|uniref:ABC transporter, ATP-binding protein n=1 Tax=Geobacter metallireducens (strain ATCC 53774 / DSM 7210 / GS-15) TaxID=269799 RepID=Q39UE6_GEOMG|nr:MULTISPECIES: ATP-binding cassette domain-containing protein [Geobacter]ABB32128.1 ABC transporter, ATP-binding protein [Geobacter metallireducens GS-15]EHP88683.1 ABC transporter related protein [Geobacter metallireducens RCH3]MBT1074544.1 ABC transporter ATP-binding protein [Geobacter grbiciae]